MSMKFINPEFQVSKSKNKKVIKVCFGTRSSGTPCMRLDVHSIMRLIIFCISEQDKSNLQFLKSWSQHSFDPDQIPTLAKCGPLTCLTLLCFSQQMLASRETEM